MTCARCGCGVFKAEDQIIMNKVWHKCCFRCSRCNKILDKCSAKLFQGEIFCNCCHAVVLEDFETLLRPCRVVSSPSCICINRDCKIPPFSYSKKYDICYTTPTETRNSLNKNIQSCSCIPDAKNKTYCFAFPMPREVANYYNRSGMRKKNRHLSQKRHSNDDSRNDDQKTGDFQPSITIRTLTPPRKRCSPARTRCSRDDRSPCNRECNRRQRCCCTRCCNNCCCDRPNREEKAVCRLCCCCAPPTGDDSKACCSCRKYRDCRCNEYEVKPRIASPVRRCGSPRKRSPHCCHHCTQPPDAIEPSESFRHSPRSYQRGSQSHSHSHRPESPTRCFRDFVCYKCRKDDPSCCRTTCEDCSRCDRNRRTNCRPCGEPNPCDCKMDRVRSECTAVCVRCGCKVYAAERISVTSGSYHTSCFSCVCCNKLLDIKNVYENGGEIYCKHCYNNLLGNSYYGYT
ncbi:unnamed protein product [Phyllotreta striolata]|uniref:LIM zinc-binding domain-containing protein n=1 Tax=Phyllotreta striolata TaxID=444603 RepID=A0A9P0GTS5_PHYSR|nr:unnamed protein product [Phyllotreta striolata]